MARTVQDKNLGTREARLKLPARGKPYWRSLDEGLHLGYRKGKDSGKWVVRLYLGSGEYKVETLDGVADDKGGADGVAVLNFSQVQRAARSKHAEAAAATSSAAEPPYTVKDAIAAQLAYLDVHKKTGRDARYRAEALILPELGSTPCDDLTKATLQGWLDKLASTPPRLRTRRGKLQQYREIDQSDEAKRRRWSSAVRVKNILWQRSTGRLKPTGSPQTGHGAASTFPTGSTRHARGFRSWTRRDGSSMPAKAIFATLCAPHC